MYTQWNGPSVTKPTNDGDDDDNQGTAIYRVDIVVSLLQWFPVLYNGSQLWKPVSHF